MLRGDVYTARLAPVEGSEQRGTRPVVIVSRSEFNRAMRLVTVVPVSSYDGGVIYPTEVSVPRGEGGLRRESVAMAHQIRTLALGRLGRRIGSVSPDTLAAIAAALTEHLGIDAV